MKGEDFTRSPKFDFKYNLEDDNKTVETNNSIPNSISLDLGGFLENFLFNPFCIDWNLDLIEDFLIKCGYYVATKKIDGDEFKVVYNDRINLNELTESNLMEVFQVEIQQILIKWLLNLRHQYGIN